MESPPVSDAPVTRDVRARVRLLAVRTAEHLARTEQLEAAACILENYLVVHGAEAEILRLLGGLRLRQGQAREAALLLERALALHFECTAARHAPVAPAAGADEQCDPEAETLTAGADEQCDPEAETLTAESDEHGDAEADTLIAEDQQADPEADTLIAEAHQQADPEADTLIAEAHQQADPEADTLIA